MKAFESTMMLSSENLTGLVSLSVFGKLFAFRLLIVTVRAIESVIVLLSC